MQRARCVPQGHLPDTGVTDQQLVTSSVPVSVLCKQPQSFYTNHSRSTLTTDTDIVTNDIRLYLKQHLRKV